MSDTDTQAVPGSGFPVPGSEPSTISNQPSTVFSDPVEDTVVPLHETMARPAPLVPPANPSGNPQSAIRNPQLPDLHQLAFDYDPHWQGKPLEPFTYARQGLAAMLASQSPGVGAGSRSSEAYMPALWAVLYLCTHQPEEFRSLRGDPGKFWEVIEDWAEEGCPRDQWPDAITLVYGSRPTEEDPEAPRILGLWEAVRANIVSVRQRHGPASLGNAPRQ